MSVASEGGGAGDSDTTRTAGVTHSIREGREVSRLLSVRQTRPWWSHPAVNGASPDTVSSILTWRTMDDRLADSR